MNVQAHMSGQISGQVPNQPGTQLPVMSQQNGNALPQMQNLSGSSRPMDPDFVRARHFMQEKIFDIIQQKQQPQDDAQRKKFRDIVRRLDEGLFRNATSKEEYTNLDTLESRLHLLIKRPSLTNQNQRYPHMVNNNSAIGAMIPTPGMSNSGNSNVMVTGSTDSSMVPTTGSNSIAPTVNTGNIMPTGGIHGGSFNRSDGPVSNGYQQSPANFSMSSGGNISSVGGQRIASQMIPTPGFSGISNQSYTNLESSSNGGGFSTVESTMVSQPQPQRQHIVGQNNNGGGQNNMLPQLPVMSQQNGNALPQMLNLSGSSRPMDPDFVRARHFMQDKIFDIIQQKQQPQDDAQRKKFRDIVRRLDDGLFRNATSKEEYTNLDTLESRLHLLIKRPSLTNQNQRYPHMVNNNSAIGAMIPTPGMSNSGNSNMMVTGSTDSSMVPTTVSNSIAPTVNTGNIMPTGGIHGGSFNRSDGPVSNGYQPSPANFSMSSGGNISSVGGQRIASQMIPTPGFSGISNQSYTNLESSSNGGGFSTVESTMVSQPQPQRQHIVGQNNRMLHSQMGGGTRSSLQSKPYGFSNGTLNGGMGLMGNNLPLNETGTSEGYLTATSYAYSPKPLQHHFDQHQRPAIQGDGYGISNAESFGSGNYYASGTSVGSMMNSQNLNSVTLPPMSKTNSPLISNQSSIQNTQQAAHIKPQPMDQMEKISFHSSLSSRDNLLHAHPQQQFQQQPHQFQQQFVQPQRQLKEQNQQPQHLLNNNAFGQSQLTTGLSSHVKREPGEHHNDILHSQGPEQFQLSEMQNQFQQNSAEDHLRAAQQITVPPVQQDIVSQNSHQLIAESQNDFGSLPVGAQSESMLQGQWHPQSQDRGNRQVQEMVSNFDSVEDVCESTVENYGYDSVRGIKVVVILLLYCVILLFFVVLLK